MKKQNTGKTVLITAGGTSEPIDNIRTISNTGTGTLGSIIADVFATDPQVESIIYVHGRGSVIPKAERVECIEAAYTQRLQDTIRKLLAERKVDAIIHSMAVSDYCVKSVVRSEDLVKVLENARQACSDGSELSVQPAHPFEEEPGQSRLPADLNEALLEASTRFDLRDIYNKIPSSAGTPVIFLQPTPKIIPELRQLAPKSVVVGFKLLDDVAQDELFAVATRLMEKNDCDFVLANDYTTVKAGQHTGYLMARDGGYETFVGKPAIAEGIYQAVKKAWADR